MFDLFRSRDTAVRILLAVILGIVAISMVTYLIPSTNPSGFSANEDSVLAKIGDQQVTTQAALQTISRASKQRQLPPEVLKFYGPQLVEQLITERSLAYEAQRLGITVTDDEVADAISAQVPAQYKDKDGKINQQALEAVLEQNGTSTQDFIDEMRRQLYIQRLRQIVMDGVVVTKADVQNEYKHKNEKVKVEYALIKPDMFDQQVQIAPADLQKYFDQHKSMYTIPEKRSVAILVVDPAKAVANATPTDSDLRSVYNSSLDRFRVPERVKVRHILLKTDAAKKDDAQVEAKAADLLKQLKGGADFGELAKKYSQDPGSAQKAGELDWIARGQTVKPFEDSAFSLKPGETSGLVKTIYGYHILQVEQRENAHEKPFEEVKDQLATEWKQRKAGEMQQQLADRARADLLKNPNAPQKAADDVQGQLIPVDDWKAGQPVPGIGPANELNNAITGAKKGEVTQAVTLPGNKIGLAEVTNLIPAHGATLDEVRPRVEAALRNEKLNNLVMQRAKALADKTKADGGDLDNAAKELGLEVKTSNDFDRQGAVEGLGSASTLDAAFGAKDGAVIGPLSAANGQAVVKVLSHTPADMSQFASQEKAMNDQIKARIGQERMSLFEAGVRENLEKSGKLKIQQATLNRLLSELRS